MARCARVARGKREPLVLCLPPKGVREPACRAQTRDGVSDGIDDRIEDRRIRGEATGATSTCGSERFTLTLTNG